MMFLTACLPDAIQHVSIVSDMSRCLSNVSTKILLKAKPRKPPLFHTWHHDAPGMSP
jgi:hypothetical protein